MRLCLASGLVLFAAYSNAAELIDATAPQLATLPVIDARGTMERSFYPVPGAWVYESQGEFSAANRVLVIADDDDRALVVARALERQHGIAAFAVAGGYDALRSARGGQLRPRTLTPTVPSFTIPSDTCQTGPALHTFESGDDEEKP